MGQCGFSFIRGRLDRLEDSRMKKRKSKKRNPVNRTSRKPRRATARRSSARRSTRRSAIRRNPVLDALVSAAAGEAGTEGIRKLISQVTAKKKNPKRKPRRRKTVRSALAHLVGSIAHRRPAKKKNPRRATRTRAARPNPKRTRYYVVNLKSRRNPEPVVEVGSVAEGCKQIEALKSHFGKKQKLAVGKVVPEGK
jgi:chemotaxis response regulator CheB